MRKKIIAANWKMYKTPAESRAFMEAFIPLVKDHTRDEIVVCPPFVDIPAVVETAKGTNIKVGGQNVYWEKEGAYTGEISGAMLLGAGCEYVIIGHSERRQYFGETNAGVNRKLVAALKQGLTPIVCVGETLAEREANRTLEVVEKQVKEGLSGIPSAEAKRIVIAYEPVWAIGTGRTATPQQAQEVHLAIRDILKDQYGSLTSLSIRIVYGGSVKPDNMTELMACEDIDGGLVGGASLKPDTFLEICNYGLRSPANR